MMALTNTIFKRVVQISNITMDVKLGEISKRRIRMLKIVTFDSPNIKLLYLM